MARRPDNTRGTLVFQEGKCIEGDFYVIAVYDDPATCSIAFSAYEMENDCTYTYPLTYSQFDALFQYDTEMMNPSNQDVRFHWIIERLDFVQDKRGNKVLCLGEEPTIELDDDELEAQAAQKAAAQSSVAGSKLDGATRQKLLKELDTQDEVTTHAEMVKSSQARNAFIGELHGKRTLEQLKASQRLQKADADREARLEKLEIIKKQQQVKAEASKAAEEAKKATMSQLNLMLKQKQAQAIQRLVQEKAAQDAGGGKDKELARKKRLERETTKAELALREAERASQLNNKRLEQLEKRASLVLKKNRQYAEANREDRLKLRDNQARLAEMKGIIIAQLWKEKTIQRMNREEKRREFVRLEEVRERTNNERERRRAMDELKQITAVRIHEQEQKEVTLKRRALLRGEYLLRLKVEASERAQKFREQLRRNERRDQKIADKEEARLRRFRESQFVDTMRATRNAFGGSKGADILNLEATGEGMGATMTSEGQATADGMGGTGRLQSDKKNREDAKKEKMQHLSGRNPNMLELQRIRDWRVSEEQRKKILEDARLKKELAQENHAFHMAEKAANRLELWEELEVNRNSSESDRAKNRQQAVIDRIQNMPVGGGLPNVLVY
eukprot:TRINITY_DN56838_c0_g1_i1.p1 TRINITY_DN56838_c0_g1~~TRINITY_DN56838_c0_g1_i1.p1  ORF type:complete len:617 (+),score=174.33 TRINITY_DN56838_c0_g1_i1:86-1936(+)